LGIIAGAAGKNLGLGATDWFLLTIALFIWGLGQWLVAYLGAKQAYTKSGVNE
jgi:type IV secretory pathway TrbD component